jgi:hypothetical protein
MKKSLLFTAITLLLCWTVNAQTTVFSDDFESGIGNWTVTGTWGLSTVQAHSPTHSLSESPTGNYGDNKTIYATMATGLDLTAALSADVSFFGRYDIEAGFDYMYVDVSKDNFATFTNLVAFDGTSLTWTNYTYSLGGFVGPGFNNVKVRFRFISDQGYNLDGMYIDDFIITSSDVDLAPPLIITTPPEFYEGTLYEYMVEAQIIDISGLASAKCAYSVDGVPIDTVDGVNVTGNDYTFTIPTQYPGAWVDYKILTVDASPAANAAETSLASYIAGEYYKYDTGVVDFYIAFAPTEGAAVAISPEGPTRIVTALIRNYTDISHPNVNMEFHLWDSGATGPGNDLITPFVVVPEASLSNTSAMTRIDLRSYYTQLSNFSGDLYVGFKTLADTVFCTESSPGEGGRSFAFDGSAWTQQTADFHFRLITTGLGVGIGEKAKNTIVLSPNPMVTYSIIRLSSEIAGVHPVATLYDLTGKKIAVRQELSGNTIQLIRDNLPSGIYVCRITGDDGAIGQLKLLVR